MDSSGAMGSYSDFFLGMNSFCTMEMGFIRSWVREKQ